MKHPEPVKSTLKRLAAAIAIPAALVGCTTTTAGLPTADHTSSTPKAGGTAIPGGDEDAATPPPSATAGGRPIRETAPCSLLSASDMAALSVLPGKLDSDSTDDDKGCLWYSARQGDYTVKIDIYALLGTRNVQATGGTRPLGKIGSHEAVQYQQGTLCAISLAITDTSRVDVRVDAAGDYQKACEMVPGVAQRVEPRLPGAS